MCILVLILFSYHSVHLWPLDLRLYGDLLIINNMDIVYECDFVCVLSYSRCLHEELIFISVVGHYLL